MSDYAAFCPFVNRMDLLTQVMVACNKADVELTVINNGPRLDAQKELPTWEKAPKPIFYTPSVPLSFSQSMNLEFLWSAGKKFTLHMHSDAIIPDGAIERLLEAARLVDSQGRKWGVIYTFYDILAIYNPAAYLDIGGYDTTLPAYFSDNDWYYRLDLAGYERIDTGIEVGHVGSATINSDPDLKRLNGVTFPLYRQYYVAKWGGEPGKELFTTPFQQSPPNILRPVRRKES